MLNQNCNVTTINVKITNARVDRNDINCKNLMLWVIQNFWSLSVMTKF